MAIERRLPAKVVTLGAGRMGQGIATAFAFAGIPVTLIDLKERSDQDFEGLVKQAKSAIETDLHFLTDTGLLDAQTGRSILDRIDVQPGAQALQTLDDAELIFEGVPEVMDAKIDAFEWLSRHAHKDAVIASTTSTFLVDDLATHVLHPNRFANAHWLNPAHLMPLVELSQGASTTDATIDYLVHVLEVIGKVPCRFGASPGYVVPRIQALAMNEAARMVEEGVGTAEEIDKAIRVGFGMRFAVLGMLEFIDWGGGDILYYASKYLSEAISSDRYALPTVIADNMQNARNGLRDGQGFFDYRNTDISAYRAERMRAFVALLDHMALLPEAGAALTHRDQE